MKKIISVVGARPNFMKVAPLHKAFQNYKNEIKHIICHTGQHYDEKMSKIFFEELEMPEPDFYLGVGSGSHAEQTAKIMIEFEKILLKENPDLVVVVGDVNSTIACALTAAKLNIKTAHIEAGLRSFDRQMPEEINRILTDSISDFLFVSEKSGLENLHREGVDPKKIFFVGNIMIDSLVARIAKADNSDILNQFNLNPGEYVLATLHRPSNVDNQENLTQIIDALEEIGSIKKVLFPVHPRTKNNIYKFGINNRINGNIILTEPLGYIEFLSLIKNSALIITDSGGIQEESTFLGVQCITARSNTERPITVEVGANHLLGSNYEKIKNTAIDILNGKKKKCSIPALWDGKTAERIATIIAKKI